MNVEHTIFVNYICKINTATHFWQRYFWNLNILWPIIFFVMKVFNTIHTVLFIFHTYSAASGGKVFDNVFDNTSSWNVILFLNWLREDPVQLEFCQIAFQPPPHISRKCAWKSRKWQRVSIITTWCYITEGLKNNFAESVRKGGTPPTLRVDSAKRFCHL